MGYDLTIYTKFSLYGDETELTEESEKSLRKWVEEHNSSFYDWEIEYDQDVIIIGLTDCVRDYVDNRVSMLLPFLEECGKYNFHCHDAVPYFLTWGGSESGAIYIDSCEKKVLIHAISRDGDISNRELKFPSAQ